MGGMGSVREAVTAGTLRASDKTAPEVAARFDAMLRYAAFASAGNSGRTSFTS